jgi:hypothetical protein
MFDAGDVRGTVHLTGPGDRIDYPDPFHSELQVSLRGKAQIRYAKAIMANSNTLLGDGKPTVLPRDWPELFKSGIPACRYAPSPARDVRSASCAKLVCKYCSAVAITQSAL